MRSDAVAAMKDLHGARRGAHPHALTQQRMWHRIVMALDFDVIIEADFALLPFGVDVRIDRQRLERGLFNVVEQRASAPAEMPRHAIVELCDEIADGGVDVGKREEALMAKLGDDPAR